LVERAFLAPDLNVLSTNNVQTGFDLISQHPDVALLDIVMPEMSGLEAAKRIRSIDPKLPVVFITSCGDSETAIEAMKLGAYDLVLKPLDLPKLREVVDRALEIRRLMHVPVQMVTAGDDEREVKGDQIVGRSAAMQEVFKAIGRVAPQNVTVLILGESGTGKELVARALYHHSPRVGKPFLAVNCAAIPETLLESELFGHEKGAFTNANQRRIGKFEQCSGGTIFLDEVGDMSPLVQSKVLRVLQEQKFERVGGAETIEVDVRVITATNRDLQMAVANATFREDLYYRLNGFTIKIPPLRDRGQDILLLVEHCLKRFNRELSKEVHGFSPEALEILLRYDWPGNIRELESVIRQSMLQSTGSIILPDFLPDLSRNHYARRGESSSGDSDLAPLVDRSLVQSTRNLYDEAIAFMERYVLARVLRHSDGNRSEAARILGITRASLRRKIHSLHIGVGTTISLPDDEETDLEDFDPQFASAER
jgi:two-component system nitrogen regulation response regulator GlnG